MTNETKQRFVQSCRQEWQRIGYDILDIAPGSEMEAWEIRKVLADYVTESGWRQLTHDERAECLKEAIPYNQAM